MRPKHLTVAILAFLVILIASFFGASIHNSKTNNIIDYLNQMDNINYYDVGLIPSLNFKGALITLPLMLIILVFEIIVVTQTVNRKVKNIALGSIIAALIVVVVGILTLISPEEFDLSSWGYVWITMSVVIFTGNILSIFIKSNSKKV